MLEFDNWKIHKDKEPGEFFTCKCGEDSLRIELTGKKYTAVELKRKIYGVVENSFYRISYKSECEGIKFMFVYGWYGADGTLQIRGYAENGERIVSPEGVTALEIAVLAFSDKSGYVSISDISVECLGEYTPKKVKLATISLDYHYSMPLPISLEYNLNTSLERIDAVCINEKPDLVVLTETFYTRKSLLPIVNAARPEDSEPVRLVRERAKKYKTHIVFSFAEVEDGNYYNTGFLIGREGEIIGKMHKSHLTMAEYEAGMIAGDEIKVFDTDIGRIAIAICWDLFFPGLSAILMKNKVDIVCHPTAGYTETRVKQRAKDCGAYLVVSTVTEHRNSVILSPEGERLADASEHGGYGCAEVDLNKPIYTYWQSYPADTDGKNIYLNEARWDIYEKELRIKN